MKIEDMDGTGDLLVTSMVSPYTPKQWEAIKGWLRHRHIFGLRAMYVADKANADSRRDPAAVAQYILGIPVVAGIVLVFLVLITACILPWVLH